MIPVSKFGALGAVLCFSAQILIAQTSSTPQTVPPDVQQRIDKIASCLRPAVVVKDDPHPCTTLQRAHEPAACSRSQHRSNSQRCDRMGPWIWREASGRSAGHRRRMHAVLPAHATHEHHCVDTENYGEYRHRGT